MDNIWPLFRKLWDNIIKKSFYIKITNIHRDISSRILNIYIYIFFLRDFDSFLLIAGMPQAMQCPPAVSIQFPCD